MVDFLYPASRIEGDTIQILHVCAWSGSGPSGSTWSLRETHKRTTMHMYPIRQAVTIAILLAGLLQVSRVEADFHLVQIDGDDGRMNGDANVQFIEITMSAQGQNCQHWQSQSAWEHSRPPVR